MTVIHLYRSPGLSKGRLDEKLKLLKDLCPAVSTLETELCYNIQVNSSLSDQGLSQLKWLVSHPFNIGVIKDKPFLNEKNESLLVEIGPRLNYSTAFSTNAVSICTAINLTKVVRFELSFRYLIGFDKSHIDSVTKSKIISSLHDRMTECQYMKPISNFNHGIIPEKWFIVDVMKKGRKALEEVNSKLGLAFDDWDLNYYTQLFRDKLKRNPTSVECFDLAQSNSEHSRHWFFKGEMVVNNEVCKDSLIDMIINTQKFSNPNNVIKFSDNSSAIEGYQVIRIKPSKVDEPSPFVLSDSVSHLIFTAETHNFPTGVAPFSGATTGTGGRIRDVQAVGRGGLCIAGTAGYSVGNLLIPGYKMPWEDDSLVYPSNLARPLDILIEASNGASDYGNKFGEPVIAGFTRSFGMVLPSGERKEWVKPIMFSAGIGSMESSMTSKDSPQKGMIVTKIGGPVYRIGVGGGSASSVQVQGDNESELDFGAVQRGDAEMENKLNRIIKACINNPNGNPIRSIHDQGAGGNGNVLKELVEPAGAVIFCKSFNLGDDSISTMELWGAEYQESDAILIRREDQENLMKLSRRERCPVDFVGTVTGDGKVILSESNLDIKKYSDGVNLGNNLPFNLDLELILGKMPRKKFILDEVSSLCLELSLPNDMTLENHLSRVFKLVSVCSKRFLTNKVDRCVTGLIAQQQCVGPIHTPVADYCITAISMFNHEGIASSIGEQPIKGLIDPSAGARMTVSEAMTNLMFAPISDIKDIKASGNWMWASKLPGEGLLLYKACEAMCSFMCELGIAVDGGKDSLSMAARVEGETVKAPGTLVVSTYAPCPDINLGVTPDIKSPACNKVGALLWVSLSNKSRLGGSALAQCLSQLGKCSPDVEYPKRLRDGFNITQNLLREKKILAGHDISDGGLITCVLEMAFAGLSGLQIKLETEDWISTLFSEEVGWVVETHLELVEDVIKAYENESLRCTFIGQSVGFGLKSLVTIRRNEDVLLNCPLHYLYTMWEETSYKLECRQANSVCVGEEFYQLKERKGPSYKVSFDPETVPVPRIKFKSAPAVAVLREEGTNGDHEMAVSLYMVGFEVWDVVMQDLLDKKIYINNFRGLIFPGGFSYADTLGSAKGWAACLKFNYSLKEQFNQFIKREDTFSFGVCNGCQLMALLGWIGPSNNTNKDLPDIVLDHNLSERFECRFSSVKIEKTPAVMCKGMEGSILGVWVAHGEGRFTFKDDAIKNSIIKENCIALKYVDDDGIPTDSYPMNPNGSAGGVAGICSKDGRHLAMMPHPERCTKMWQWPYVSPSIEKIKTSPWIRLFHNAFIWTVNNTK